MDNPCRLKSPFHSAQLKAAKIDLTCLAFELGKVVSPFEPGLCPFLLLRLRDSRVASFRQSIATFGSVMQLL